MRTKIIVGNIVAVLVVGLVSYFILRSQLASTFVEEVDSRIASDHRLFERSWRLSQLELTQRVAEQASAEASRDIFSALSEPERRQRAKNRADGVAEWFAAQDRPTGPPEVVLITDSDGVVISRNLDLHRMHGDDLKTQLRPLASVLRDGDPAADLWAFSYGQSKLLATGMAPIRDVNGQIIGAMVVGFDLSNGMAQRIRDLLGRDVAFVTNGSIYSSSLDGARAADLRRALFEQHGTTTRAALAGEEASDPWLAQIGGAEYIGLTGALPMTTSARAAYCVMGNRSAQIAKASAVSSILVMTALGLLIVVVYGFLVGSRFLRPIEQMEEGVLAIINGRTDTRLDIDSAELGGLAYRINQLLNVMTGTPESDDEGRVSSPPEMAAWGADAGAASEREDEDDPELAAKLAAEPEDEYYERVFNEYVAAKEAVGEDVSSITKERFVERLAKNESSLQQKHDCRMVRFVVTTRGSQVNLRPVIIR